MGRYIKYLMINVVLGTLSIIPLFLARFFLQPGGIIPSTVGPGNSLEDTLAGVAIIVIIIVIIVGINLAVYLDSGKMRDNIIIWIVVSFIGLIIPYGVIALKEGYETLKYNELRKAETTVYIRGVNMYPVPKIIVPEGDLDGEATISILGEGEMIVSINGVEKTYLEPITLESGYYNIEAWIVEENVQVSDSAEASIVIE